MVNLSGDDSQQNPLLAAKLYIPPTRPELVPRPRLTERMNAASQGKLTVVSAPASFGKTTLLGEWVRESERPTGWLSLDQGDDNLVRFLSYLIAALQRIDEGIGVDVQAALGAPQAPPIETLLTMLINDIAAFERELALILDDCHRIDAQPIHDALDFLLDHLPENMQLVLSGRVDLPLHFSRLRVGGQLTEIRQNDLRFTKAEVAIFLNDLMGGLILPTEQREQLSRQLAALIGGMVEHCPDG
jgi:LuxR family maltose regulon positive regulatory protein